MRSRSVSIALAIIVAAASLYAVEPVNKSRLGGLAIKGTDPVAYFTESKAVKGSEEFEFEWMDAKWRFATAANRDAFAKNPAKYAPQYGGYCAYAVSEGYTAGIDPESWRIVDGKLYLNYSREAQKAWEKDIPGRIRKGDANWPKLLKK